MLLLVQTNTAWLNRIVWASNVIGPSSQLSQLLILPEI